MKDRETTSLSGDVRHGALRSIASRGLSAGVALLASLLVVACGGGDSQATVETAAASTREIAMAARAATDKTPPQLAILDAPAKTDAAVVSLNGTASDETELRNITWVNDRGGSGAAKTTGSITNVTWVIAQVALLPGFNKVTVTVTDKAGNKTAAITTIWRGDITPPTVQVTNAGTAAAMALTGLSGSAGDNIAVQSVTWVNSLGGSGTASLSGTATAANWSVASLALQVGTNVITLTATDTAGNQTSTALSIQQADITPPTVLVTQPGSAAAMVLSGLAGTAGDNVALKDVTWANSLGGGGTATLSGAPTAGTWSVAAVPLQVGMNVITVTATDTAGNQTFTSVSVAQADITPPTLQLTSIGSAADYVLSGLAGNAGDNVALQGVAWVNSLGGSGSASLSGTGTTATWSVPALPLLVGTNVITVTATDTAGNRDSAQLSIVQADITAPTVQVTNPGYAAAGVLSGLAGAAADNVALLSVTWVNSLGGSGIASVSGSTAASTWTAGPVALQVGTNVITVTATDTVGNKSTAVTTAVVLYPTAPRLDLAALTGALTLFEMPWNDTAASPLSPSSATIQPAGSAGPIVVNNGHFVVGGNRIRLFGVNLTLGTLTPTYAEADAIAANLAKQGFNAVRLHGLDRPYIGRTYKQQGILNADWATVEPTAGDLFDYFIARLIQNGLYVKIMAHSDRVYPEAPDCFEHCEGLDIYLPALIASQKNFLAMLLGRVNPYTGRSYGNEPGIFAIEINNEDALVQRWRNGTIDKYVNDAVLGPKYAAPLKSLWNDWLAARYTTPEALAAAWGTSVATFSDIGLPLKSADATTGGVRMTDWWKFVGATEESYWSGLTDYIKGPLGFRGLVSGGQMNYSPTFFKPKSDFTDIHYYWHSLPSVVGTYAPAASQPNSGYPIYAVPDDRAQYYATDPANSFFASANRVNGRPHVISEYSVRFQNTYGSEGEMLMLSYALFQDWDGIFLFTYSDQNLVAPEKKQGYLFNDAIRKVTRVPASIMFRRGDVAPGLTEKVYAISKERTFDRLVRGQSFSSAHFDLGSNLREPFRSRVSHTVVDTLAQEAVPPSYSFTAPNYNTDTNELRWKAGSSFTIDTPRSQMRTAVLDGQSTALGTGVNVSVGTTMLGRALLTLTSLSDAQNIPQAATMLLTVTGDEMAEYGWRSSDRLQRVIGVGSNRLEAVPAQVTIDKASLDVGKRLRVYALDDTGNIKLEVPVVDTGTALSFVVGPGTDSPWYLLEQR